MTFRLACIQPNAGNDMAANIEAASALVRAARGGGADFIAMPENVAMMELGRRNALAKAAAEEHHPALKAFQALAGETGAWLLVGSLTIDLGDGMLANRSFLLDGDGARAAARDSELRWARGQPLDTLDGVPVAVKDLILPKGRPTLRGPHTLHPEQPSDEDAPVTGRRLQTGAVARDRFAEGWGMLHDGRTAAAADHFAALADADPRAAAQATRLSRLCTALCEAGTRWYRRRLVGWEADGDAAMQGAAAAAPPVVVVQIGRAHV